MDPILRARELGRLYLDGRCDFDQAAELQRLLRAYPEAADAFAHLSRLESDLSELFSEEPGRRRQTEILEAIERHTRRRRRLRRALSVVAASLLLLVGGPLLLRWWVAQPGEAPPAPVGYAVIEGVVVSSGKPVERFGEGDRLLVAGTVPATLRLPDGSQAKLQPASQVVLLGAAPGFTQRIELVEGEGRFRVRPSSNRFRVETPAGSVTALGTEFDVQLTQPENREEEMTHRMLLAVVVLSGLVEVESSEGTHRLAAGESRVFGRQVGEREPRPKTYPVSGTVTAINGKKLTISIGRRPNATVVVEVGASVKIVVDGKPGKLSDLSKGTLVRLEKNDKDELLRLSAEGPLLAGQVTSVGKGKITLESRGRDPQAEGPTFEVPDDVKVSLERKPAKLSDVKPGSSVVLRVSVDRKRVLSIELNGARAPVRPLGQIKKIDEKGKSITVTLRGKEGTFPLGEDVRVSIDGKPGKLADLEVGTDVVLLMDREGKTVQGISVVQVRVGPPIQGVVREVKDRRLKLTVRSRAGMAEETFTVAEKARVVVDGKSVKLADLPIGTRVEILKDRNGSVADIQAAGPLVVGTVKALANGKLTLVDRALEERTWPVAADAKIFIDGKPGKLADVKPEVMVAIRLTVDGKRVLEIRDFHRLRGRE